MGTLYLFIICQFPILFNGNSTFFSCCQFSILFNGAMVLSNPIGQKSPCVLQDIVSFGAAALLTITYIHQHTKQGNGYRWPHIALGRLVRPDILPFRTSGNSPLCPTGHRPFGAAALLSLHYFTWSLQAGQRVPLTMCDPWMTSYTFLNPASSHLPLPNKKKSIF